MENNLRKEAESLLGSKLSMQNLEGKSIEEVIHELKVHQIELELQNEELLKTQQELIASRKKYFELFDLAPIAYLIVDTHTRIFDANLTATSLLQIERADLKGKKFNSFIHPDHQDAFYLFFKSINNQTGEAIHESCLLLGEKNIYIRIACNMDNMVEETSLPAIRITLMDITPEKRALIELETVKEKLELSLLAGNVAWWVWDYPSQKIYYDKKKAEMLGYQDGQITQNINEIFSMIHPDDHENTMQHLRDHLEGNLPGFRMEYRLKTRQGSYKWFFDQGSVTQRDSEGKPLKICGVVIDITEKKLAELQNFESDIRFRQFAALLPQVVCELDGDFNILYVNDFGKKLFGIRNDESKNLMVFLNEHNQKVLLDAFYTMVNSQEDRDPGIQITFKSGSGREITLYTYANYELENGKIKTVRAIGIDLSDRIKLEHQLNALNKELNAQKTELENFNKILEQRVKEEVESNRAKDHIMSLQSRQAAMGEMIEHIAHQWKQPLNTLNLIVTDLQDAFAYNELTREYLDRSVDSAKEVIHHMAQTIDDFRNFFKPMRSRTAFNLRGQTNKALSFIRTSIEVEEITLENHIADDLFATGFPNEYLQVIINIVNNAREAILENKPAKALIQITSGITDEKIVISISNNAGPISSKILPHIFDPYFSTKEDNNGTGIGLYMAKNIITQNMDGKLEVKNKEDGVVFEIILPLT